MRLFPLLAAGLLALPAAAVSAPVAPSPRPVERAVIESSLPTGGRGIRQFAFDADPATAFVSDKNATKADHLTLTFDHPVALESVVVLTGRAGGADVLATGVLEVSADGTTFESVGRFSAGKAEAAGNRKGVKAVRVRPTEDLTHPLVVREFTIRSEPRVVPFRYPVEIALDVTDAPEMKEWGDRVVRICEREYTDICTLLASDGYTPPTQIKMALKSDYKGVAMAGGTRITGSVSYFKKNPGDVGAMVHETAHCVQSYKGRGNPGWLVEGVADYVRFWKYEPGKAGRLQPERAKYDASYRITAAFLAFVSEKYDPQAVPKLNAAMREGRYTPEIWRTLTGKSVDELNQEWRQSLAR
jgi:hypothetical protein